MFPSCAVRTCMCTADNKNENERKLIGFKTRSSYVNINTHYIHMMPYVMLFSPLYVVCVRTVQTVQSNFNLKFNFMTLYTFMNAKD